MSGRWLGMGVSHSCEAGGGGSPRVLAMGGREAGGAPGVHQV